ncbi:MAG: ABC transporter permease [Haloferacaceae archaeon]
MKRTLLGTYLPHKLLLVLVVAFLYVPIGYIVLISFNQSTLFPFPFEFTLSHYRELLNSREYFSALRNSLFIGLGSAVLSMVLGASAAWAVVRQNVRYRSLVLGVLLLPLVLPKLVIALADSVLYAAVLPIPSGVVAAALTQAVYGISFGVLIMLAQMSRYPSQLDEAAKTYGADTFQRVREVVLPIIWPGLLGAFLIPFIIAFNNFTLTFYTVGATTTLPTTTWGQLRHGIQPALFSLSAAIVIFSLVVILGLFFVLRHIWTE